MCALPHNGGLLQFIFLSPTLFLRLSCKKLYIHIYCFWLTFFVCTPTHHFSKYFRAASHLMTQEEQEAATRALVQRIKLEKASVDPAVVQMHVSKGARVMCRVPELWKTILTTFIEMEAAACVEACFQTMHPIDFTAVDQHQDTILHLICKSNHLDAMDKMLRAAVERLLQARKGDILQRGVSNPTGSLLVVVDEMFPSWEAAQLAVHQGADVLFRKPFAGRSILHQIVYRELLFVLLTPPSPLAFGATIYSILYIHIYLSVGSFEIVWTIIIIIIVIFIFYSLGISERSLCFLVRTIPKFSIFSKSEGYVLLQRYTAAMVMRHTITYATSYPTPPVSAFYLFKVMLMDHAHHQDHYPYLSGSYHR
eukprot:gene7504-5289_t